MTQNSRTTSSGYVLLPVGIALVAMSNALHGLTKGLLMGGGLGLLLVSAMLLGASIGQARTQGQGWLPSRDRNRG